MIYTVHIYDHNLCLTKIIRANSSHKNNKNVRERSLSESFYFAVYMYTVNHKTEGWIHGNQTVDSFTDAPHRVCILSAYRFPFSFQHSSASFESHSRPVSATSVVFSPLI